MITQEQLIRNFSVMENEEVDFFLGSGASVNSGISTGGDLVWFFKREIYCYENNISTEQFRDLKLQSTRNTLQEYFDSKEGYPSLYSPSEYSFYFEKCYESPIARKRFIESKVVRHNPSIGYLCLAELMKNNKVKRVWTTNFDDLVERAMNTQDNHSKLLVCSSANAESISLFNPTYPCVCKLHGDFRYDKLQNTTDELKSLEEKLKEHWEYCLRDRGMIVIGYSGSDESIMSFLESNIDKPEFISKGFYWTTLKGHTVSKRVFSLIEKAKKCNKIADIVEIDNFDTFLYTIYKQLGFSNSFIEEEKNNIDSNSKMSFLSKPDTNFIKLNAFKSIDFPKCNCFKTDIKSWKQLRNIVDPTEFIVALYNSHIYSFESEDSLKMKFENHIKSDIIATNIDKHILDKSDSIYIGMLYDLIKKDMLRRGLLCCRRNKYYDESKPYYEKNYIYFDAIEFSIEYSDGYFILFMLPSVHITNKAGTRLEDEEYKCVLNRLVSRIYNKQYNEKLRSWQNKLHKDKKVVFEYNNFHLSFMAIPFSSGGNNRENNWLELKSYLYDEPIMCFSDDGTSTNQIKGLLQYGPVDYSKSGIYGTNRSIKLALLSPSEYANSILEHLEQLNKNTKTQGKDFFIQDYTGFQNIYKKELDLPKKDDSERCLLYPVNVTNRLDIKEFTDFLKRGIDIFSRNSLSFDVLVIYIPTCFERFRESKDLYDDFNLHDSIKLYAAGKGIFVQFIEEHSVNAFDKCKVKWGLSTGLYVKAQGSLWRPKNILDGTAYVGIGYANSENKGICIGCSQLFDSTGTGLRMILKKIKNPRFYNKVNPYMDRNEAREMMTELRESYYHCCPTKLLKRIVVHKTTPFMKEEIIGISQAFEGIDIDLIQIQEFSPWRGIRFGIQAQHDAENYCIKRGTAVQINDDAFLLWTHGSLVIPAWTGSSNYFKGGRGIPTPLIVRRFRGKTKGDLLVKEILMLTKMNWNSGDSLYKVLPVTIDFAKILSRMSKQNEIVFDNTYDFRYFM